MINTRVGREDFWISINTNYWAKRSEIAKNRDR